MKLTAFSLDNIISITDLREDIDSLRQRLAKYPYTVIFKNRSPFFIAVEPEWFQKEVLNQKKTKGLGSKNRQKAVRYFDKVARETGDWQAAKVVIKMREQEKEKWKK